MAQNWGEGGSFAVFPKWGMDGEDADIPGKELNDFSPQVFLLNPGVNNMRNQYMRKQNEDF